MKVQVNGEPLELEAGATIVDLLSRLGLAGQLVAVERNREIVTRSAHASTTIADGDELEVVQFVGGG